MIWESTQTNTTSSDFTKNLVTDFAIDNELTAEPTLLSTIAPKNKKEITTNPSCRDNAMLLRQRDDDVNVCWPLSRDRTFIIGRDDDCDMVLADRQVSRRHAMIRWNGEVYQIEDLGSTNGTHVNGKAVQTATSLIDGYEFQIGFKFRIAFVDDEATTPLKAASPNLGLCIDHPNRTVRLGDAPLEPPLSPPQFQLLQMLWDAESTVVSRDEIAEVIWPDDIQTAVSDQAIDALVRRLRERIAELDPETTYISNVRGFGFRLQNQAT